MLVRIVESRQKWAELTLHFMSDDRAPGVRGFSRSSYIIYHNCWLKIAVLLIINDYSYHIIILPTTYILLTTLCGEK